MRGLTVSLKLHSMNCPILGKRKEKNLYLAFLNKLNKPGSPGTIRKYKMDNMEYSTLEDLLEDLERTYSFDDTDEYEWEDYQ